MALDPSIILRAGTAPTPDYAGTMELRSQLQLRNAAVERAARQEAEARTKSVRLKDIGGKAAGGDLTGARRDAAASGDVDALALVDKLDTSQREAVKRRIDAAAPLAFEAQKVPYDQRRAFINSHMDQLAANGWSREEVAALDPTDANLSAFVTSSIGVKEQLDRADKAAELADKAAERRSDREFQRGNAFISAGLFPPSEGGAATPAGGGTPGASGDVSRLINTDAGGGYLPDTVQTLGQFVEFGRGLNKRGAKSSSAGTYQINGSTMRDFGPKVFGKDWASQPFNAETQDAVGREIFDWAKAQRNPVAALRGRWVGLDAGTARKLVSGSWEDARGTIAQSETGGASGASANANRSAGLAIIPGGKIDREAKAELRAESKERRAEEKADRAAATAIGTETMKLRKEFEGLKDVKDFNEVRANFKQVEALGRKPTATAQDDIALIFSYMKMLDPGSVVREGEFATAQNAAGIPDQIANLYNKALEGNRLNAKQRVNMVGTAATVYKQRREKYNTLAEQYQGYAKDSGIEPTKVSRRMVIDRPKGTLTVKPPADIQSILDKYR